MKLRQRKFKEEADRVRERLAKMPDIPKRKYDQYGTGYEPGKLLFASVHFLSGILGMANPYGEEGYDEPPTLAFWCGLILLILIMGLMGVIFFAPHWLESADVEDDGF